MGPRVSRAGRCQSAEAASSWPSKLLIETLPVCEKRRTTYFTHNMLITHCLHRNSQHPLIEINLPDREIIGGAPVRIHLVEQFRGKNFVHVSILLFAAKAENAANRLGYHTFLIRANDADHSPAGRGGNHALIC